MFSDGLFPKISRYEVIKCKAVEYVNNCSTWHCSTFRLTSQHASAVALHIRTLTSAVRLRTSVIRVFKEFGGNANRNISWRTFAGFSWTTWSFIFWVHHQHLFRMTFRSHWTTATWNNADYSNH